MKNLDVFGDDLYGIVHLTSDFDVSGFMSPKGKGLERYLKYQAIVEEKANLSRTYLVLDKESNEIAAYFTLRTGLITLKAGSGDGFNAHSAIELSNFAVNDAYRDINDLKPGFGMYVFNQFILPLAKMISQYVGAAYIYIYSLPYKKLMVNYEKMGFFRATTEMEAFIYSHVKPIYDKGCIFMWQKL